MKMTMQGLTLLAMLALGGASLLQGASSNPNDRTITKVVKLLQGMLTQSKIEGDSEAVLFAKHKCYCDTNKKERDASMVAGAQKISVNQAKIEELQGSSGELSSKVAKFTKDMAANVADRGAATGISDDEKSAFDTNEGDLDAAIASMKSAISILAAVGGDQAASTAFVQVKPANAGAKFLQESSSTAFASKMQKVLAKVEPFMSAKERQTFMSLIQPRSSLIQGPEYTSQSTQVVGVIKSMLDTMESNLALAKTDEKNRVELYNERNGILLKAYRTMQEQKGEDNAQMGTNDGSLSSTRGLLTAAQGTYDGDDLFLNGGTKDGVTSLGLVKICANKATDFDNRKVSRASEEAAISQAVSILNSDAAFETFGKTAATKTGETAATTSFLQISRHIPTADVRTVLQRLLQRASAEAGHMRKAPMPRLKHVVSLLKADNPFETVLKQITKMVKVIDEEGVADDTKKQFCEDERRENDADVLVDAGKITSSELEISANERTSSDNEGSIESEGILLRDNNKAQKDQTTTRKEENVVYQANIKNLVASATLLTNAVNALKKFYDNMDKAFLQSYGVAEPQTWDNDSFSGQKENGGNSAITMLQFIHSETLKEETAAHDGEAAAQAAYEDAMTELKTEEGTKQTTVSGLESSQASLKSEHFMLSSDLKETQNSKAAMESYLLSIKPGCDFIMTNHADRTASRQAERGALTGAVTTLKGSAAYSQFEVDTTNESYGECKDKCVADATHVKCKACMADTTIVGYCAGHKDTMGCAATAADTAAADTTAADTTD